MKTFQLLTCFVFAMSTSASFGAAGMFDQFLFISTDGTSSGQFYDVGASTGNPDFASADLGTFDLASDQLYFGGQQKTFKNNGTDVTSSSLFYRIFPSSSSPSGSFTEVEMVFQVDNVGGVFGDQQWGGNDSGAGFRVSSDVLAALSPGDYTVEVYTRITTNGVDAASEIFNNVGGSNYAATFTAIPEPNTFVLSLLAVGASVWRRRR